jgi:hypothetical protein
VYGNNDVPENLMDASLYTRGRARADVATAMYGTLNVRDGYNGSVTGWVDDIRVPTRLGKEQTVVRLSRARSGGTLEPWAEGEALEFPLWKRWALSEVRISARVVPQGALVDEQYRAAVAVARTTWGRYEQEIPIAPLVAGEDGTWTAALSAPDGSRTVHLKYSMRDGLVIER